MKSKIAAILLKMRSATGLSQRAVADACKITPAHLCDLERGNRYPSTAVLRRIVKLYQEKGDRDLTEELVIEYLDSLTRCPACARRKELTR